MFRHHPSSGDAPPGFFRGRPEDRSWLPEPWPAGLRLPCAPGLPLAPPVPASCSATIRPPGCPPRFLPGAAGGSQLVTGALAGGSPSAFRAWLALGPVRRSPRSAAARGPLIRHPVFWRPVGERRPGAPRLPCGDRLLRADDPDIRRRPLLPGFFRLSAAMDQGLPPNLNIRSWTRVRNVPLAGHGHDTR